MHHAAALSLLAALAVPAAFAQTAADLSALDASCWAEERWVATGTPIAGGQAASRLEAGAAALTRLASEVREDPGATVTTDPLDWDADYNGAMDDRSETYAVGGTSATFHDGSGVLFGLVVVGDLDVSDGLAVGAEWDPSAVGRPQSVCDADGTTVYRYEFGEETTDVINVFITDGEVVGLGYLPYSG